MAANAYRMVLEAQIVIVMAVLSSDAIFDLLTRIMPWKTTTDMDEQSTTTERRIAAGPPRNETVVERDDDRTEEADACAPQENARARWTALGLPETTIDGFLRIGIFDDDDFGNATNYAASICSRARELLRSTETIKDQIRLEGIIMVDSLKIRELLSTPCACGACGSIESHVEAMPESEIDGWPYRHGTDLAVVMLRAMGIRRTAKRGPSVFAREGASG